MSGPLTVFPASSDVYRIFWRDELFATATDVGWEDFPWAGGKIILAQVRPEIVTVLQYVAAQSEIEEGHNDWPFTDTTWHEWRIVRPDGVSIEISPPVVDSNAGQAVWR